MVPSPAEKRRPRPVPPVVDLPGSRVNRRHGLDHGGVPAPPRRGSATAASARAARMARSTAGPLGVEHFMNPKQIPEAEDMVMLSGWGRLARWPAVIGCLALAFLGLYLLIDGVYTLGSGPLEGLLQRAMHPLAGLLLGILISAVAQSSTATTALTIAAVATGSVSVPVAVPVIIGANIGTTVTPLLASFSYADDRGAFRRAFSTASLHAWFNASAALLLFILEAAFHPLERISEVTAEAVGGGRTEAFDDARVTFVGFFQPAVDALGTRGLAGQLPGEITDGVVCIALGAILALVALRVMARQLRVLFAATTRSLFERLFGMNPLGGFSVGLFGTATVQASAVTVSALLPFAATRILRLTEALWVILGANLGTTISGLVAALTVPGAYGVFGLQAALVHVFFNVAAVLVVTLVPGLRRLLYRLCGTSARRARRSRLTALGVVLSAFYVLPLLAFGAFLLFA